MALSRSDVVEAAKSMGLDCPRIQIGRLSGPPEAFLAAVSEEKRAGDNMPGVRVPSGPAP